MPFFQWSQSMSVGVALLDSDHQALIRLINRLHEHLEITEEPDLPDDIFEKLVAYIDYHFAREEEVMQDCDYPMFADHKDEHLMFTQEIRYVRDRYVSGDDATVGQDLLHYLKNWLTHHILIQDMDYKTYVAGHPRANDHPRQPVLSSLSALE